MTRAEILDCLTDRPCDACRFHESGKCERWECVFEEKPDDAEPCEDLISEMAVDKCWLYDWYITSVGLNDSPVWTEEHIEELYGDFYLIPKNEIEDEQKEPCEDAISRQAVDDAIYDYSRSCDVNYGQIMERIDNIPSVTPKQKMGHWIYYQKNIWIYAQCSECGTVHDTKTNYCPNCGAKMVEPRESEDNE